MSMIEAPPASLGATETEYVVDLDVTGFTLPDLHVEIEDHEVTVHGEAAERELEESIRLPADADVEWVRASYLPGLLELRAPRLRGCESGPRVIEITRHRVLSNPDATPC